MTTTVKSAISQERVDFTVKSNTIIACDDLRAAYSYIRFIKNQGVVEIFDNETRTKGGRKYRVNDSEVVYITVK